MLETSTIPDKPFFRINEVCQVTDTQPYVLRFWESEFPQLAPERKGGGQGLYRREDVALVLRIKQLLYDEDYTLDGVRAQIEAEGSSPESVSPRKTSAPKIQQGKAPELESESMSYDGAISRSRYEDAIEEIAHLRLVIQESESKLRKSDGLRQTAERRAAHHQARSEKLFARFERLLEILENS